MLTKIFILVDNIAFVADHIAGKGGMTVGKAEKMAVAAVLAALTAIGAFVRIPLGFTSITLQLLFTLLAGALLGPAWGAASQAVYVALGLLGLPIFTMGGSLGYVFQPSFGFLLGMLPMAAVCGGVCRAVPGRKGILLGCLAGEAALYLVGVPYMGLILNVYLGKGIGAGGLLMSGMVLYLPGDMLKVAAVTALAPELSKRLPGRRWR